MMDVTPWWQALKLRKEIVNASGQLDDVQMSLFQAVHGTGVTRPPYADASYYGEITHPTARLVDLLCEVAIRLGGGDRYTRARALTRLDQGMGGGKSHACIGAFHLATSPGQLLSTDLGQQVKASAEARIKSPLVAELGNPQVVVLSCDNMTPGRSVDELDGPAKSLYERFLWRLFDHDYNLYDRYRGHWNNKDQIAGAIKAVNRPVLIVIDEVLDYIGNGLDGAGDPELAAQDMAFLRALLDVVNDVPHCAAIVAMIAADKDRIALSPAAEARRKDLSDLLPRNGLSTTVTEAGDFASILRRRLFDSEPPVEVIKPTAELFTSVHSNSTWIKAVWDQIESPWRRNWLDEVAECYPFHPSLIHTAETEWSLLAGFQKVRSTIRIFAATVYALQQRGRAGDWVPALIGPGDLPLSDNNVLESVLSSGLVEDERTVSNYRNIAEIEITNPDQTKGTARTHDLKRAASHASGDTLLWQDHNPRAAERAATAMFLASVVGTIRVGKGRGATNPELKAATIVPGGLYTVTDAETVIDALTGDNGLSAIEVIPGQGNNKPARYFLSTRLTHRMLLNDIRKSVTDADRDAAISDTVQRLMNSGPFGIVKYIRADQERKAVEVLMSAGIDQANSNRLFVLDPSQFSLRNGLEKETLDAITAAMGLPGASLTYPVTWASSAVFAVVNTQRRSHARKVAVEYVAASRALDAPEIQKDADLRSQAQTALADAKTQFEKSLKRAYQHYVFLAQPDPDADRFRDEGTFDDDVQTSLNGTLVWKALSERDKAFDQGQFTSKALMLHLRDSDYDRPLNQLRSAFYSAPRLPLLPSDDDLRRAIYEAVRAGTVQVVTSDGSAVAVAAPDQINLTSAGLRLAKPQPTTCPTCSQPVENGHQCAGEGTTSSSTSTAPSGGGAVATRTTSSGAASTTSGAGSGGMTPPATEKLVKFTLTQSLKNEPTVTEAITDLFRVLYESTDSDQITYLQGTLQMTCDSRTAKAVLAVLTTLGITAQVTDLSR